MGLEDRLIQTVRLPRHSWRFIASHIDDSVWDTHTGQNLLKQLQLGIPLHPAAFGNSEPEE